MVRHPPNAPVAHSRRVSTTKVAARDTFYSKLFTRLSIAVFLAMAVSVVGTALLYNQGF